MKNKKTMYELAKEFPEKTYRGLEKYRDADRNEEAQRIFTQQENQELKEDQLTKSQRKQEELEPIKGEDEKDPQKDIKIIDNYLTKEVFKTLQDAFLGNRFPWFYNKSKTTSADSPIKGYEAQDQHQFTHTFFGNEQNLNWTPTTAIIAPLLDKIKPRIWIRVKSNMSTINSKPLVGGWHCDMLTDNKGWSDTTTALFYINTNNGYTMFENGEKVPSVENRLVIIRNDTLHTGVSQTDTKVRVVLNLNYL